MSGTLQSFFPNDAFVTNGELQSAIPQLTTAKIVLTTFGLLGLQTLAFNGGQPLRSQGDSNFQPGQPDQNDIPVSFSALGTPVFDNLQIQAGTFLDEDGNSVGYAGFESVNSVFKSIDSVLIDVNQSKNIVRTGIVGRNGQVKEYTGMDDYDVRIRGALVDPNPMRYPHEQVSLMQNIMVASASISVISKYLQRFEIFNLLIKDFQWRQVEGCMNAQAFEIFAYSDTPLSLIVEA